jgi:hypothetical protein
MLLPMSQQPTTSDPQTAQSLAQVGETQWD